MKQKHNLLIIPFLLVVIIFFAASLRSGRDRAEGTVCINEVCTSNLACLSDEEGHHPDWIELYNSGQESVSLAGWRFSDSEKQPDKWIFPEVVISPGEYLLLYAHGEPGTEEASGEDDFDFRQFLIDGGKPRKRDDPQCRFPFRLSQDGCRLFLADHRGQLRDSVEVPGLRYDTTYARITDGGNEFGRRTPTPGESNRLSEEGSYAELGLPEFSVESGFYTDEFLLTLQIPEAGEIHYTMDGSEPDESSPVYSAPIRVADRSGEPDRYACRTDISPYFYDYMQYRNPYAVPETPVYKCTVVRAKAFDDAGRCSGTATKTYFVGQLPEELEGYGIVSLVTDPDNLFDPQKGIYVIGNYGAQDFKREVLEDPEAAAYAAEHPELPLDGSVSINGMKMSYHTMANYNQSGAEWERPADFTVFDSSHALVTQQEIGIRIKGNGSRWQPQKSFKLFSRKCYSGSEVFTESEKLISGYQKLSRLLLYSCADDETTKLKDALYAELTDGLDFTSMEYRELYYVFLDGEFWGSYRLCSERDSSYLADRYDIAEGEIGIVKERMFQTGSPQSRDRYESFRYFMLNCDLSQEKDYREFQEFVDLESLLDYYAARLYLGDAMDWPMLNSAMWSAADEAAEADEADGRWRFLNYDNNNDMRLENVSVNSLERVLNGREGWGSGDELLQKLTENREFCGLLASRMERLRETVFEPDRAKALLNRLASESRKASITGNRRFFKEPYATEVFDRTVEEMQRFFEERGAYIVPAAQETLGLAEK